MKLLQAILSKDQYSADEKEYDSTHMLRIACLLLPSNVSAVMMLRFPGALLMATSDFDSAFSCPVRLPCSCMRPVPKFMLVLYTASQCQTLGTRLITYVSRLHGTSCVRRWHLCWWAVTNRFLPMRTYSIPPAWAHPNTLKTIRCILRSVSLGHMSRYIFMCRTASVVNYGCFLNVHRYFHALVRLY